VSLTWEELAKADRGTLNDIMRAGTTPDPAELVGHTYRGLNIGLVPRLTVEKFKKVFSRDEGGPGGHNLVIHQDRERPGGEWRVKLKDGDPERIGWFRVSPTGRNNVHFDYNVKRNTGVQFVVRGLHDFVVLPNANDHRLLLGKAYYLRIPIAHFVIEREDVS
jgi:hypothetical protein